MASFMMRGVLRGKIAPEHFIIDDNHKHALLLNFEIAIYITSLPRGEGENCKQVELQALEAIINGLKEAEEAASLATAKRSSN